MFDILLKNMTRVATSHEIIGNYIVLTPNDKNMKYPSIPPHHHFSKKSTIHIQ